MSTDALEALLAFPWPGNIRQLENAMQQAVLLCGGPELLRKHLPQPVRDYAPSHRNDKGGNPAEVTLAEALDDAARDMIQTALDRHDNSLTHAARALGISRVAL